MSFSKIAHAFKHKFGKSDRDREYRGNEHISSPELVYHTNKSMTNLVDVGGVRVERERERRSLSGSTSKHKKKIRNSLSLENASSPPRSHAKSMVSGAGARPAYHTSHAHGYQPIHDVDDVFTDHTPRDAAHTPLSPRRRLYSVAAPPRPRRRAYTTDSDAPPVPPLPVQHRQHVSGVVYCGVNTDYAYDHRHTEVCFAFLHNVKASLLFSTFYIMPSSTTI